MHNPFETLEERLSNIEALLLEIKQTPNMLNEASNKDLYVSIGSACSLLSVSRPTIYEYLKEGRIRKFKIGSTTRLLKSEVLSMVIPC